MTGLWIILWILLAGAQGVSRAESPPPYAQSGSASPESVRSLPQGSEENPSRIPEDEILPEDLELLEYLEMLESMELLRDMELYRDMNTLFDDEQKKRENDQ